MSNAGEKVRHSTFTSWQLNTPAFTNNKTTPCEQRVTKHEQQQTDV